MSDQPTSRRDFVKQSTALAAAGPIAAVAAAPAAAQNLPPWPASQPGRKKVLWAETPRWEFPALLQNKPVVLVPIGSIEQHGPHLPVDNDISIPYHIAVRTAEIINEFPVLVAPPVWTGFTHYNMGYYGTITVRVETFIALLSDICRSIYANGFERIVLMNGHGGNVAPVHAVADKLAQENIITLSFPYWAMCEEEMRTWSTKDGRGPGHAGEWETSFQMYLRPHLVAMDHREAGKERWPFSEAVMKYAHVPERRRESPVGSMGDPFAASAEKGERIFNLCVERLTAMVRDYHEKPLLRYMDFGSDTKVLPTLF